MIDRLVQHYLEMPLAYTPEKIAVLGGRSALSYGELATLSNRIAHRLKAIGVKRQDRVILSFSHSPEFVAAVLGVLKADAVYVPVDPRSPHERYRRIAEQCAPRICLCDGRSRRSVSAAMNGMAVQVFCLESAGGAEGGGACEPLLDKGAEGDCRQELKSRNTEGDLAYILYTSGSTGTPKGVMITHGNIRSYIDWAVKCFDIGSQERILGTSPFHGDMSTFDIWCPIKAGATLCLSPEGASLFPERLIAFMEEQGVTLWKGVSSLLMYMERTGALSQGRIPSLKRVLFGGEVLPTPYLMRWMETFPEKEFFNVYGPTEATGISLYHRVESTPTAGSQAIPIGLPKEHTRICLLGENSLPVVQGEIGELCIAGPGLSPGYLDLPLQTQSAFLLREENERWYRTGDLARQRPDGAFEFLGRRDHRVKIMGYRIELSEIEQALLSVDCVHDAALTTFSNSDGFNELVAFYEGDERVRAEDILAELRKRLPVYMLPRRLCRVDEIPRNDRGKIDRRLLHQWGYGESGDDRQRGCA